MFNHKLMLKRAKNRPSSPPKMADKSLPDSPKITAPTTNAKPPPPPQPASVPPEYLFDDTCVLDMDYFVKTISGIKSKGVRPDLVGSIIAHYSSKWLPDLSLSLTPTSATTTASQHKITRTASNNSDDQSSTSSTSLDDQSMTAMWMKKRFFVETLVGILPVESGAVPCNFLLRLLRVASMVGVEPTCRSELEGRIACQLDQAEFKELLIPSFSHTCGTLLDVELVTRLVKRFLMMTSSQLEAAGVGVTGGGSSRSGMTVAKVARLVDSYLAEAAVDSDLGLGEFIDLAGALPSHARPSDDGLYRAIDTYLKAHPNVTKQERKLLCRLIDTRKLSAEASLHASQNERLPVRVVIQVLYSEQGKLSRQLDWSGPIGCGTRLSPSLAAAATTLGPGVEQYPARCLSKREPVISAQQAEIRKLKEDLLRLQSQCNAMQGQMERLMITGDQKKSKGFFSRWRKLGMIPSFRNHGNVDVVTNISDYSGYFKFDDVYYGRDQSENINVNGWSGSGAQNTPMEPRTKSAKGRTTPNKWRKSTSS